MKSRIALERELTKVKRALKEAYGGDPRVVGEQYGVMQALEWALEHDAAAPHTLAPVRTGTDALPPEQK